MEEEEEREVEEAEVEEVGAAWMEDVAATWDNDDGDGGDDGDDEDEYDDIGWKGRPHFALGQPEAAHKPAKGVDYGEYDDDCGDENDNDDFEDGFSMMAGLLLWLWRPNRPYNGFWHNSYRVAFIEGPSRSRYTTNCIQLGHQAMLIMNGLGLSNFHFLLTFTLLTFYF